MASRRRKNFRELNEELQRVKAEEAQKIGVYMLDSCVKLQGFNDLKAYDITLTPKVEKRAKVVIKTQTQQTPKPTTPTANLNSDRRDQAGNNFSAKH